MICPGRVDALNSVGEADAELKVTLSYYIEPNPGKPIISRKRTYQSYGLQFEIKRPKESDLDFKNRINKLQMLEEGENATAILSEEPVAEDGDWVLGKRGRMLVPFTRTLGSAAPQRWRTRGKICIYPRAGWWKHNKKLKRWDTPVRYSLILSIRTPAQDVDLYTSVDTLVKTQNAAKAAIKV